MKKIWLKTAVEIRAGNLTITGGTLTSTVSTFSEAPNGSGTTMNGAALAVSQHTTDLELNVVINGGTFNGVYAIYEKDLQNETARDLISISITDGTFNGGIYSQNWDLSAWII